MSNRTKKARAEALKTASQSLSKSNKHITKISATSSRDESKPSKEALEQGSSVAEKPAQTSKQPDTKLNQNPASNTPGIRSEGQTPTKPAQNSEKSSQPPAKTEQNSAKSDQKPQKPAKNSQKSEKPLKQVFILFRPFVALGRYLRDSWREIRQVRWPNRKATWKMTLAVIFYCALFMVFVLLLDTFFTFLIELLVK